MEIFGQETTNNHVDDSRYKPKSLSNTLDLIILLNSAVTTRHAETDFKVMLLEE